MMNNKKKALLALEKEKKERSERELKEKLESKGLAFQDYELPPDELEEKAYKKSQFQGFLSMIPFTEAYYEASAAEDEMDNLRKIRIEKAKASDLLAMTKMGRHEEALAKMMSETNNDFYYFNKLRTKLEAEGKVFIEAPNLDPFADMHKGKNRNRVKKAHGKRFDIMSADDAAALAAMTRPMEDVKRPRDDAPCIWRGKDKEGEYWYCTNLRMRHPTRKVCRSQKL